MIFYFTGTGNSKHIAERLAMGLEEEIINIADCVRNEKFEFALKADEKVGFVVPVYFMGVPIIVTEFFNKLKISAAADYYSYLVLNCGGTTANAEKFIKKQFKIAAVFGVESADNYVPMYKTGNKDEVKQLLDSVEKAVDGIIKKIKSGEVGSFNAYRTKLPRLMTAIAYPLYKFGRKTKKFTVSDACIGCGLCEQICPRQAIKLENNKPKWIKPKCEICLGCLHRCPVAAINYGKKSANNGRYVNPRTKL